MHSLDAEPDRDAAGREKVHEIDGLCAYDGFFSAIGPVRQREKDSAERRKPRAYTV